MKRVLQIVLGLFALVGIAYTAMTIYANVALPKCMYYPSPEVMSPDGEYFALFEQTRCEDMSRSRATVAMGRTANRREHIVWMRVTGTSDVRLTWNGSRELFVVLPRTAGVETYGPYDGWPRAQRRDP